MHEDPCRFSILTSCVLILCLLLSSGSRAELGYPELLNIRLGLCSNDPKEVEVAKKTIGDLLRADPQNVRLVMLDKVFRSEDRARNTAEWLAKMQAGQAPANDVEKVLRAISLLYKDGATKEEIRQALDIQSRDADIQFEVWRLRMLAKIDEPSDDVFIRDFKDKIASADVDRRLKLLTFLSARVSKMPPDKKAQLLPYYEIQKEWDEKDPRRTLLEGILPHLQNKERSLDFKTIEKAKRDCPADSQISGYYRVALSERKKYDEYYATLKKDLETEKTGLLWEQAARMATYFEDWDQAREDLAKAEVSSQNQYDPEFHQRIERLKLLMEDRKKSSRLNFYKLLPSAVLLVVVFLLLTAFFVWRKRRLGTEPSEPVDNQELTKWEEEMNSDPTEFVTVETLTGIRGNTLVSVMDLVAHLNAQGLHARFVENTLVYLPNFSIQVPVHEAEKAKAAILDYQKSSV